MSLLNYLVIMLVQPCHVVSTIPLTHTHYRSIIDELIRNGHTRIQYDDTFILIEEAPSTPPTYLGVVLDRLKIRDSNRDRLKKPIKRGLSSHQQQVNTIITSQSKENIRLRFSAIPMASDGTRYDKPTWQHLQNKNPLGCCQQCGGLGHIGKDERPCQDCQSTGLGLYSTMLMIQEVSFKDIMLYSAESLHQWLTKQVFSGGEVNELAKILTVVKQIGLTNPLCQKLNTLSTGERSRARICSVISQDLGACLYILDEPSLGLDEAQCLKSHPPSQTKSL